MHELWVCHVVLIIPRIRKNKMCCLRLTLVFVTRIWRVVWFQGFALFQHLIPQVSPCVTKIFYMLTKLINNLQVISPTTPRNGWSAQVLTHKHLFLNIWLHLLCKKLMGTSEVAWESGTGSLSYSLFLQALGKLRRSLHLLLQRLQGTLCLWAQRNV